MILVKQERFARGTHYTPYGLVIIRMFYIQDIFNISHLNGFKKKKKKYVENEKLYEYRDLRFVVHFFLRNNVIHSINIMRYFNTKYLFM